MFAAASIIWTPVRRTLYARNVAVNTIGTERARAGMYLKMNGPAVMAEHILPVVIPVLLFVRMSKIIAIMRMAAINLAKAVLNAVWQKLPIRIACPAVTDEC